MAEIVDFKAKKAERIEQVFENAEVIPERLPDDTLIECGVCQNKAFMLITTSTEDSSFPGFDVICTACDTIMEMVVK